MQDLDLFSAMASENNESISENTIEMDEDYRPLAERMRPRNFDEYIGQEKILGKKSFLRRMVQEDKIPSMILYGPPGTGKTTLAKMIAGMTKSEFSRLNAVSAGISDVRKIIEKADENRRYYRKRTIIFLDEIHRFNKAQQDVLLPYVEDGRIILIGATTENPYFEVNHALLSTPFSGTPVFCFAFFGGFVYESSAAAAAPVRCDRPHLAERPPPCRCSGPGH